MARKKRTDSRGRVLKVGESQRTDGRYSYRFTDVNGKRQNVYAYSLAELRELERQIEKDKINGIDFNNATLNQWFDDYMELKKDKLKETTYTRYNQYWNWYVRDKIGQLKIRNIKRTQIVKFYLRYVNGIECNKLAGGTIQYINNLLFITFEHAMNNDVVPKNPCNNILKEFNAGVKKDKTSLTREEQQLFFDCIDNTKDIRIRIYKPLFVVGFGTGMRIGELLALTWDDIDWKNNYISVSKTIHYLPTDNGKYRQDITSPKTKNAVRKIPMLEEVRQALEEQRQNQIKFGIPTDCVIDGYSGFIFTTSLGKPYLSDGINSIIKRVRKKYNRTEIAQAEKENRPPILLPDFSPHIMRHTFCTRLCECDLNLKAIQSIMGHGSVKTSMDIYTHVSENKKQQEIKKLENIKISS